MGLCSSFSLWSKLKSLAIICSKSGSCERFGLFVRFLSDNYWQCISGAHCAILQRAQRERGTEENATRCIFRTKCILVCGKSDLPEEFVEMVRCGGSGETAVKSEAITNLYSFWGSTWPYFCLGWFEMEQRAVIASSGET